MMIFDCFIGLLIAALAGMGIGGGGLLVIWLVLIKHLPSPTAQGINLLFFIISALCALPIHIKRRTLSLRTILVMTSIALPGVWIGCQLAAVLPEMTARRCFGYFLLLSGAMQGYRQIKAQFFS